MAKVNVHKTDTLTGHRDCIYSLAESNAENLFFSGAGEGWVVQWQLTPPAGQAPGKVIAKIPGSVYALCYLADVHQLAVGHNPEGIHLIDLNENREISSVKITNAAVFDIKYADRRLWVACGDGNLVVLDSATLAVLKVIRVSDKHVRTLAINPESGEIATGCSDAFIRVYDLQNYKLKYNIAAHQNSVFSLTYSPDYQFLLSGSRDAHLKVWSRENEYQLHTSVVAHLFTINHIAYSPEGKHFATCSKDKSIKVWEAQTFRLLKVIDRARHAGHGTSVNKLLWTPQCLISCSDDRSVSVWKIDF